MSRMFIPRQAFADILNREIQRRDDPALPNPGGMAQVCHEVAASGLMSYDGAARRIYSILNPEYFCVRRKMTVTQQYVEDRTVDKFLVALDLQHLWRTELEDKLVPFTTVYPNMARNVKRDSSGRFGNNKKPKRAPAPSRGTNGSAAGGRTKLRKAA